MERGVEVECLNGRLAGCGIECSIQHDVSISAAQFRMLDGDSIRGVASGGLNRVPGDEARLQGLSWSSHGGSGGARG